MMLWLVHYCIVSTFLSHNTRQITFCRRGIGPKNPKFREIFDTFCDDLFFRGGENSLESIRNGQEVLFKPEVNIADDVDQAFLRSFVISMGKSLTGHVTFTSLQTLGNNFFARDPAEWFMGPYDLTVSLHVQGYYANLNKHSE